MLLSKSWKFLGSDSELYKLQTLSLKILNFKIFFKNNTWSLPSIWSMEELLKVYCCFFHLQDAQTNKQNTNRVFPRTPWMRFTRERTFFPALWTDKNPTLEQKWLCNKQILIRYHEKLNLSVQKYWKDKMQGLQNIKCIPLGHTSRFHPLLMVAEICCETRFRRSQNALYVSVKDEHFFLFILTILLRKCFEYAHITRDWICFESGLDYQSPKWIYN